MFSLFRKYDIGIFEYLYMFIMVIYLGQMTPQTGRMVGTISGDPIPFLLPIVLTVILVIKHPISFFNRRFIFILIIFAVWSILTIEKYQLLNNEELSYYFFLFYSLIVAFIHVQVFGKKLIPLYEDIIVKLCIISLILWTWAYFDISSIPFFKQFDQTSYGNNFFYLFNWMDPSGDQVYEGIARNAGFSWEPGRFSICVVLALLCNIARNGITFLNFNVLVMLAAIATTLSTTGYVAAGVLYIIAFSHKLNTQKTLLFFFILVPALIGISQLGFMQKKIEEQLSVETNLKQLEKTFNYNSENADEGEYLASLERFTAMYFEWDNVRDKPVLGYGRNPQNSYFYESVSSNFALTGGLVKLLAQYGIPLGVFLYFLLLISSFRLNKDFPEVSKVGLFFTFIVCSISYAMFTIPIFTAFWFYGIFFRDEKEEEKKKKERITSEEIMKILHKSFS
ncbi:MAG: O-antigen ligase family protein [Prevotella sp.]|nr:O-antigen ligase family protein [Prevotella sp.]